MTALENDYEQPALNGYLLIGALAAFLVAIALGYSTSTFILVLKGALLTVFVALIYSAFRTAPPTFTGHLARAFLALSLGVIFFVWTLGYRFLPKGSSIDLWMQLAAGAVAVVTYSVIWKLQGLR